MKGSLHSNQSEIAMDSNLPKSTCRNVVKRPLSFETAKCSFDCSPLLVKGLKLSSALKLSKFPYQSFMPPVHLDNSRGLKLVVDSTEQTSARVPLVCENILRVKSRVGSSSFCKHVGGPCYIMHIACADVRSNGQFVLRVNHEVQFPSQREFSFSMRVFLDAPLGFGVRRYWLPTIHPALERRAINGYTPTKAWKLSIMLPHQSTGYVLHLRCHVVVRQLIQKPSEGGLVRDVVWRTNAARVSNERILFKGTYQGCGRWQTQHMFGDKTVPEGAGWMSLASTPRRAYQSHDQRLILKGIKNRLELSNDGRLLGLGGYGRLDVGHSEANPSRWFRRRLGGDTPCVSVLFISTSVLRYSAKVNCLERTIPTNSNLIWLCIVVAITRYRYISSNYRHTVTKSVSLTADYDLRNNTNVPWYTSVGVGHRSLALTRIWWLSFTHQKRTHTCEVLCPYAFTPYPLTWAKVVVLYSVLVTLAYFGTWSN